MMHSEAPELDDTGHTITRALKDDVLIGMVINSLNADGSVKTEFF